MYLFTGEFSLFNTAEWALMPKLIQDKVCFSVCLCVCAGLLTCIYSTAWDMCSKSAMSLEQQANWGQYKAWIRCRKTTCALLTILKWAPQQPSLPSPHRAAAQVWPLYSRCQMSLPQPQFTKWSVWESSDLESQKKRNKGKKREGEVNDEGLQKSVDLSPSPPCYFFLLCNCVFVQTLTGQAMQQEALVAYW